MTVKIGDYVECPKMNELGRRSDGVLMEITTWVDGVSSEWVSYAGVRIRSGQWDSTPIEDLVRCEADPFDVGNAVLQLEWTA